MRAGQLNRRIAVMQRTPQEQDSAGQLKELWQLYKELWADVRPVSGREFVQGQQIESQITMTFEVRHITTITTDMRVHFCENVYAIEAVIHPNDDHRRTQIMCREM